MDIYAYIKSDHRKVARLIDDLMAINLPYVRQQIFNQIRTELSLHAEAEEATFYTAIVERTVQTA
ncbi:MAG: hemerythrin domain-containing protein [Asticcacaulis sp.]